MPPSDDEIFDVQLPVNLEYKEWVAGTKQLLRISEQVVLHRILAISSTTPQQETLRACFLRMLSWFQSLARLDNPGHSQASCGACRSLMELMMDMELINRDASKVGPWQAFKLVNQYKAAKTLVNLVDANPTLVDDVSEAARKFVSDSERKCKVDTEKAAHWSGNWPKHWSGGSIYGSAELLGPEFERLYRVTYYKMCEYVHAGSGGPLEEAPRIAMVFCYSHMKAQEFFYRGIEIVDLAHGLFNSEPQTRDIIKEARYSGLERVRAFKAAIHQDATKRNSTGGAPPTLVD